MTFLHHWKACNQIVCKLPKGMLTLESLQEFLEAAVLLTLSTVPQIRDVSGFNTHEVMRHQTPSAHTKHRR